MLCLDIFLDETLENTGSLSIHASS
uniref:Uncharacterized protein n=1 Tax=Arundo donax TaxID=35708 RepID=A0A0A9GLW7_ARUDO